MCQRRMTPDTWLPALVAHCIRLLTNASTLKGRVAVLISTRNSPGTRFPQVFELHHRAVL